MSLFYRSVSLLELSFLAKRNLQQLQKIEVDVSELFSDMVLRNGGSIANIKSQIGQDVFALYGLNWNRNGYFV